MPTLASLGLLPPTPTPPPRLLLGPPHLRFFPFPCPLPPKLSHNRLCQPLFASAGSQDEFGANRKSNSKAASNVDSVVYKWSDQSGVPFTTFDCEQFDSLGYKFERSPCESVLSNLIQEIEPLDVSVVQKDVPADTVDAIKRTISGMLGLLPSDHFHVSIDAFWEPLSKLLISSMMTGYTLRNAEYKLCLERNLDIQEMHSEKLKGERAEHDGDEVLQKGNGIDSKHVENKHILPEHERLEENDFLSYDSLSAQGLGQLCSEAQEYIHQLQARLSSAKNELHDLKRKNAALQMQQFVGEEKNDLLDYLRSLEPEKVAELSEPTSAEVQEIVHSVVHGLLATLSPKMHSKAALQSDNSARATLDIEREDFAELVEDASLHFQPLISVTRDYLARLLFWCMLLGHHLRGLEYRVNLAKLLPISKGEELES